MTVPSWLQYSTPCLDRPFGVALWPVFEKAYSSLAGELPQDFHFVPGQTPMSTWRETVAALVTYYTIIFGGRELMKGRNPIKLQSFFKVHNFYLTIISGALLALFLEQLIPTIARGGIFHSICHYDGGWTDKLVILYYLNYLTKYLELLDTAFLVVKKKPLTFLHTYHHGATALLCFTQLIGNTSVSWVPIALNLMVHVVMYWYYFQSARGIQPWWKKGITMLQILQFVIDLGFIYFASYTYFSSQYFPSLPTAGKCAGEEFAAVAGMGILSSYLVLFIGFYLSTYEKPGKKAAEKAPARAALEEMKNEELPDVDDLQRQLSGNGSSIKAELASVGRKDSMSPESTPRASPPPNKR